MIAELFIKVLLAHLIADFMLQPKEMALNKSNPGWNGTKWCLIHCIIYTICVCIALQTLSLIIIGLVFLSHYPIDRYSLASKWLKFIKGRDILNEFLSEDKYKEIHLMFACIVYVVVDNTMHLILLYGICMII